MTTPAKTTLDDRGFIHVRCNACGNPEVWLKCEKCDHSDHFLLENDAAHCSCGATWQTATCLCGAQVPPEGKIAFVPFQDGPMALADLELDWGRITALGTALVLVLGGVAWWIFA